MREIKFRAWDKEEKFMLQNIQSMYDGSCNHKETEERYGWISCFDSFIDNDNYVVMQYTGLKDKNGTEIYEGDVMVCRQYIGGNFIDYCIERGFVEMLHGAFGLHRKQGYYRPFKDWLEAYEYEVIGNIYENPELLK